MAKNKKNGPNIIGLLDEALIPKKQTEEEIIQISNKKPKSTGSNRKTIPMGVSLYQEDLNRIRELQEFFILKEKIDSSTSKIIRCALRLASTVAKENEYLLCSICEEVENEDSRKKLLKNK